MMNEENLAEIEFLDSVYLFECSTEILDLKLVRKFRTSGNTTVGFKIFINDIEIDFLSIVPFDGKNHFILRKFYLNFNNHKDNVEYVEFLKGEKEKTVKISGKKLTEIACERLILKIFIKNSDFESQIGQRNEAIIFIQNIKGISKYKINHHPKY